MVAGLARPAEHPLAVLASDPMKWVGALTADGSDKLRRMVDLADTFHLPVVNLVDQPGFAIGTVAEHASTIRQRGKRHRRSVSGHCPMVHRDRHTGVRSRSRGAGGSWRSRRQGGVDVRRLGTICHSKAESKLRRDLEASEDPKGLRAELLEQFESMRSPLRTAEGFGIEEVIDPRTTREILCDWVALEYRRLPRRLGPTTRGHRP